MPAGPTGRRGGATPGPHTLRGVERTTIVNLDILLLILLVTILHWPYRLDRRRDFLGREYGRVESLAYRYDYGPSAEHLDYVLMRRFQRLILALLREAWAALRGDLLRLLVDDLRRRLGL